MKVILMITSIIFSLMPNSLLKAQTLPPPEEIGTFFGNYLCQSFMNRGMVNEDEVMEQFMLDLIDKYGEENSNKLISKMQEVFTDKDIIDDSYKISFFKGTFNYFLENDPCLKILIKEMF